jgi:heme o synthase
MILELIKMTSPLIALMVVWSALAGVFVAGLTFSNFVLALPSLLGIALAACGALVLNNYYDSDIDKRMVRTKKRASVTGKLAPRLVLIEGVTLIFLSLVYMYKYTNWIAMILTFAAVVIYFGIYTILLKRRSPYAIEIGSFAGALPPVIAYVSISGTGSFGVELVLIYVIQYLWQLPHSWALSSMYKEDYRQAKIPILPLIISEKQVLRRSLLVVLLLSLISIYLLIILDVFLLGIILWVLLSFCYIYLYKKALGQLSGVNYKGLFRYSIIYLSSYTLILLIFNYF